MKRYTKKAKSATKIVLGAAANPGRTKHRLKHIAQRHKVNKSRHTQYQEWFEKYEKQVVQDLPSHAKRISSFKQQPLISILLPTYNTNPEHLRLCIQSVIDQSYEKWELCIVDDASPDGTINVIKEITKEDDRIKYIEMKVNQHIAGSTNEALKIAKGEFIALLDHDDLLMPNALFEMAKAINENPHGDLFHSDEDKVEDRKGHSDPFFKPDWSPDFLRSCNYITHFAVLRTAIVKKINGFRLGTEGAQDWDLFLRFIDAGGKVVHVPKMLYSWRKSETSTASNSGSKPYAYINQQRALRDHVARNKDVASVLPNMYLGFWNVKYHPTSTDLVSIIIPTKNQLRYIKRCLSSIVERTTYPYFEIIIVDTGSTDKDVLTFYESKFVKDNPITIVKDIKQPFNYSRACNTGVKASKGEYLLFLNNDTEVITEEWIEGMLGQARRKHVGMVGCKLLFPTKNIQHAGVVLSKRDIAFHPFYNTHQKLDIYTNIYISNIRNCSAVTAACSMVSRAKFDDVGGFDEKLRVTYNDVDLNLRLLDAGYFNVYTPYTEMYHYESVSVGRISKSERDHKEVQDAADLMRNRWGKYLAHDPFYNPNFIQHGPGYEI